MKRVEENIRQAFCEATGSDNYGFSADERFLEAVDSITKMSFMIRLEEQLGVQIPWTAVSSRVTLADLLKLLEKECDENVGDHVQKI